MTQKILQSVPGRSATSLQALQIGRSANWLQTLQIGCKPYKLVAAQIGCSATSLQTLIAANLRYSAPAYTSINLKNNV